MKKEILDILEKTYNNPVLRQTTVPLFMSSPGTGKSTIIKQFAKDKGVKLVKITLSQRMPNEIISMMMPNSKTGKLEVYDSLEIASLSPGDILFFDEVFNGSLKQSLDAVLNFTEDRITPSGREIKGVMLIAASNPQGLMHLSPQIKERFIRYDLKFNKEEFQEYMKNKYGMPENISNNLCILVNKEKFEHETWNYLTPRSLEKAINQIGCELPSAYDDVLMPYLKEKLKHDKDIKDLNYKKGKEIEYLELLKLIIRKYNQVGVKPKVSKKVEKEDLVEA